MLQTLAKMKTIQLFVIFAYLLCLGSCFCPHECVCDDNSLEASCIKSNLEVRCFKILMILRYCLRSTIVHVNRKQKYLFSILWD